MGAWAQHSSADERATSSYLAIALASGTSDPYLVAKQSSRSPEGKRYYRRPSRNHHDRSSWVGRHRCRLIFTGSGIGVPDPIGTIFAFLALRVRLWPALLLFCHSQLGVSDVSLVDQLSTVGQKGGELPQILLFVIWFTVLPDPIPPLDLSAMS